MTRAKAEPKVYVDEGCDSFPSCLACPLNECKYVDPTALARWKNQGRDSAVVDLTAQGLGPRAISERLGIGESTVARIRRGGR